MAEQLVGLRGRRDARGWTVTELARRSATSDLTVRTLEAGGRTTPEARARIEAALGPVPTVPEPPAPDTLMGKVKKALKRKGGDDASRA